MNQCYKIIYSKVHQSFVVVSELTKSHGKGSRVSQVLRTVLLGACLAGLGQQAAWGAKATNASVNITEYNSYNVNSSAWGKETTADCLASTAFGKGTAALSDQATAWGEETRAGLLLYASTEALIVSYKDDDSGPYKYKIVDAHDINGTPLNDNGGKGYDSYESANQVAGLIHNQNATAFGYRTTANTEGSTAWGNHTVAGMGTVQISGNSEIFSGTYATAWGNGAKALGYSASAWGDDTLARGARATAFGENTEAEGENATVWGYYTHATAKEATAWGNSTEATGEKATAWGYSTHATHAQATAWGEGTNAGGESSTAFGVNTNANGFAATAWGGWVEVDENGVPIAYRQGGTASGDASTAFGIETEASGEGATAWGKETVATGDASTAFGINSKAYGQNSLAALGGTTGKDPASEGNNGENAGRATRRDVAEASGTGAVAVGVDSNAQKDYTYAIGKEAKALADNTIAIGNKAQASVDTAVALGSESIAKRTANNGVSTATTTERNSVNETRATTSNTGYDVSTGTNYAGEGYDSATWTSTLAAVSVGGDSADGSIGKAAEQTRQITGVAAGTADTDAVNVAQLKLAKSSYRLSTPADQDFTVNEETKGGTKVSLLDKDSNPSGDINLIAGDNITLQTVSAATDGYGILISGKDTTYEQKVDAFAEGVDGGKGQTTLNVVGAEDGATPTATVIAGKNVTISEKDGAAVINANDTTYTLGGDSGSGGKNAVVTLTGTDNPNARQELAITGKNGIEVSYDKKEGIVIDGSNLPDHNTTYTAKQVTKDGSTTFNVKPEDGTASGGSMTINAGENISITAGDNGAAFINAKDTTYTAEASVTGAESATDVKKGSAAISVSEKGTGTDGTDKELASLTVKAGENVAITEEDGAAVINTKDTTYTNEVTTKGLQSGQVSKLTITNDLDKKDSITFYDTDTRNKVVKGNNVTVTVDGDDTQGPVTYTINAKDTKVTSGDKSVKVKETVDEATGVTTYDLAAQRTSFAGDTGETITNPTTLNIVGKPASDLTEGNIGVESNGTDTLTVKLAKDVNLGESGSVTVGDTVIDSSSVTTKTVNATDVKAATVTATTVRADSFYAGDNTFNSTGFQAGNVTVTKDGFKTGNGGPSMTADGIDAGDQVISNVKDGKVAKGSKEAVTGGQLYDIQQQNSSQDDALKKLAHRDAQLERKIYRAGAHAAAIAALHPLDYDEDHKFTASAGIGQYHGSSAIAVGAFYRPTENLMFSVGASLNENDSMVNAGMSYRFGTGSGNKTSPSNIHEMKRQISNLSEENRQLSAQLNSSEAKLASADSKIATSDAKIERLEVALSKETKRSEMLEEKIRRIERMLKLK